MRRHLAIMRQPFLDLIIKGKKTIESRFSKVRCEPYGMVEVGDIIFMKESGGLVLGEFEVDNVQVFELLTPLKVISIQKKYREELCVQIDNNFWQSRLNSIYATLIHVKNPKRYEVPYKYHKIDRRGWVVIDKQKDQVCEQLSLFDYKDNESQKNHDFSKSIFRL